MNILMMLIGTSQVLGGILSEDLRLSTVGLVVLTVGYGIHLIKVTREAYCE